MPKLFDYLRPLGTGNALIPKNIGRQAQNFLFGTPEKRENVSTLRPEQEGLYNQLVNAGQQQGAGGAFGTAADYYRNLLSDDSEDYNAFSAPMLRQYHQDIVPGIAEQFAGMGSGGLSSSGFRNAQMQGATDLSERLGQIRANLRQSGAQGLQNIGGLGLQNFSQNMATEPGSQGFLSAIAPAVGGAVGTAIGGPIGGFIGSGVGNAAGGWLGQSSGNRVGANTGPYTGSNIQSSPRVGSGSGGFRLPNFLEGNGRGF